MNLIDVNEKFNTDEKCLNYLEKMRWPDGIVRCPTCGDKRVERYERPTAAPKRRKKERKSDIGRKSEKVNLRRWFYVCLNSDCREQFSPTSGTIFHDSHLPLTKWFHAVALILNAKKGMSALQLGRDLGLINDPTKKTGYKTAWYLAHRIRKAMEETEGSLFTGTVEVDECYPGGKYDPRRKRARYEKPAVVGLIERGNSGRVRTMRLNTVSKATLVGTILKNTDEQAHIMTDEHAGYKSVGTFRKHDSVNHIKEEWVRGNVHTNSIENYWSLFKRGLIGSFHQVSVKHLERYMAEFDYRFNHRRDGDAFIKTIARMCGTIPMQFKQLTADPADNQF
jgi:transposase-like protein